MVKGIVDEFGPLFTGCHVKNAKGLRKKSLVYVQSDSESLVQ